MGLGLASLPAVVAAAAPIPGPVPTTLPHYQGAPAEARVFPATKAPQNPHLARGPRSNIHNDSWMTDAYRRPGPLGNDSRAVSGAMPRAVCGSLTFQSRGLSGVDFNNDYAGLALGATAPRTSA